MSKETQACLLCGEPVIDDRNWFRRLTEGRKIPLHPATFDCVMGFARRIGAPATEEDVREAVRKINNRRSSRVPGSLTVSDLFPPPHG